MAYTGVTNIKFPNGIAGWTIDFGPNGGTAERLGPDSFILVFGDGTELVVDIPANVTAIVTVNGTDVDVSMA